MRWDAEDFEDEEGCECDEEGIDEKEVHRAEEEGVMARCQPVSGCAERRHQSGSDGYAGDDIALFLTRIADGPCNAAAQGDDDIPDGRRGACQKLVRRVGQRRDGEVEGGRQDGESHLEGELDYGLTDEVHIVCGHAVPDGHDPAHERGDQHGADDDGDAVHVQADTGNHDGHDEDDEIRPRYRRIRKDALVDFLDGGGASL